MHVSKLRAILSMAHGGLIGADNTIPWRYPGDLKRFKERTMGGVVIMGRRTYESIGKALPGRANIVVSSGLVEMCASASGGQATSIQGARSLPDAIAAAARVHPGKDVWLIGGARIYEEGMRFVDEIDMTLVPFDEAKECTSANRVYCPPINDHLFVQIEDVPHPYAEGCRVITYGRRYR